MKSCADLIKTCPYMTMDEYHFMRSLAAVLPTHQRVVMIGAGPGQLLLSFLEGYRYPTAVCTVIDKATCDHIEANLVWDESVDIAYVGHIEYVVDYSAAVAKDWIEPIDLLIIDGDHSAKGVQQDIQGWARHVKKYIWFHDYDSSKFSDGGLVYDDSRSLIDAYAKLANWQEIGKPGCSAVFRVMK
jgi:hypothetical protein